MSILLSIDPGGVGGDTGIVLVEYRDDSPGVVLEDWAVPGQVAGFLDWYYTDYHWEFFSGDVLVEKFVPRNIPGADYSPILIEGAITALLHQEPDANIIWQPASGKNSAVPDSVLRRVYDWPKGDHHADRREAARHAFWWLKKQRHMPTLERMYPR